jgi:integrase
VTLASGKTGINMSRLPLILIDETQKDSISLAFVKNVLDRYRSELRDDNKEELIDAIAKETEDTKVQTKKFLDAYIKVVSETLTKGDIQRLISKHTYGTQKQLINCINNIWYFAINSGLLGDNPPVNPTKDYKINKEKIKDFPAVKHNKVIFNKEMTRVIWEELINCRDQFPFRAECLLFMLVTGTRQSETLRIKKADIDLNKNIITLQKAKSGKTEVVMITPAVIKVLNYLKELEKRENYQWSKFTPWLFSTTQFRVQILIIIKILKKDKVIFSQKAHS